ncbi:uncharacterized protein LOC131947652 [Physella acuta]|uniref:uncharacterized protein LOC131947652 n=1 Tax=Physella acuta TaxID=109671 RepID=UPI0027DD4634|nr:uncharacterized protein LOC131947652 [Physella acuta]
MFRHALILCIFGLAWGRNINPGRSQSFRMLDANGDGHISRSEIQDQLLENDVDGNWQVTLDEYERRVNAENRDPSERSDLRKLFGHLDRDQNGVLNSQDIDAIFDEADSDRDDRINHDEYDK